MLELTIRLVASLAVVVGLMLLLAKLVGQRYGARPGSPVQVLHRQPLSRSASVSVLTVGGRVLVVGATEQSVSLLTELDPEELQLESAELEDEVGLASRAEPVEDPGTRPSLVPVGRVAGRHAATGALAGSVLSPQTWRQALAAAMGKTA